MLEVIIRKSDFEFKLAFLKVILKYLYQCLNEILKVCKYKEI